MELMERWRLLRLEAVDRCAARIAWVTNEIIETECGPEPIRAHFVGIDDDPFMSGVHVGLYRCPECRALCCWCFGGDDDVRCDQCSAGEGAGR